MGSRAATVLLLLLLLLLAAAVVVAAATAVVYMSYCKAACTQGLTSLALKGDLLQGNTMQLIHGCRLRALGAPNTFASSMPRRQAPRLAAATALKEVLCFQ
jgi:hypothetical protein